jgi:hypothetical protein
MKRPAVVPLVEASDLPVKFDTRGYIHWQIQAAKFGA